MINALKLTCFVFASVALVACAEPPTPAGTGAALSPVLVKNVRISDSFWTPRQAVIRKNSIPHSWQYIEKDINVLKGAAGGGTPPFKNDKWSEANLYKLIETMAFTLATHPDPSLERQLDELITIVVRAQQEDGYVHGHVTVNKLQPWGTLPMQHDGYVCGHMYEAAAALFRNTGKKSLLEIAKRSANQAYEHFAMKRNPGFPGHAEIELALVDLYRITAEPGYLQLARKFIERRGSKTAYKQYPPFYFQDHLPAREQDEIRGHAVRATFFATGVADVAMAGAAADYRNVAIRLWNSVSRRKMYITGSAGAASKYEAYSEDYDLPNNGYCESCAACALVNFAHRMLLLTRDGRCADIMERILYNAVLHGIAMDGKSFYYRNPPNDSNHPRGNNWCCCPPTLMRTISGLGRYVYADDGRDIYINLYVGNESTISLSDNSVTLAQITEYPWNETIAVTVVPEKISRFSIFVRIPEWCKGARVTVNSKAVASGIVNGYVRIDREWNRGDLIALHLPLPAQLFEANPKVAANREMVALQRGPLVYGLESIDNKNDIKVTLPHTPKFKITHRADLLGGITTLEAKAGDGRTYTFIPFYTMANRGKASQATWIPLKDKKESPDGWTDRLYRVYSP